MKEKHSILKFEIFSTIFTIILGTLLHFTFKWSNNNPFVGIFSSINESTWEHLKLIFFPMLITAIIGHFCFKNNIPNYLCTKTKGILISLSFLVIFFYTYTGIIGKSLTILNIGSFPVSIIIGEYFTYKKIKSKKTCNNIIPLILLSITFTSFILFTFSPPHIGIFKDPLTNNFGFKQKK